MSATVGEINLAYMKRNPRAPPRPMSAYAIYLKTTYKWTRERLAMEQGVTEELAVLDVIAKEWASLSESEVAAYRRIASNDELRYKAEMAGFHEAVLLSPAASGRKRGRPLGKAVRRKKDPHAPKRGASAFLLFANDHRGKLRAAHPEKHNVEISKMLGAIWKTAPIETRQPYFDKEVENKARYRAELTEYNAGVAAYHAAAQPQGLDLAGPPPGGAPPLLAAVDVADDVAVADAPFDEPAPGALTDASDGV